MLSLNTDLFFHYIEYLPFHDVINLCSSCKLFHDYGINPKYHIRWKNLTNKTYSFIYDYQNKQFPVNNYLSYTQLVNKTDNITRSIIYFRKWNDPVSINHEYSFLALFILNRDIIKQFIPQNKNYFRFIKLLDGKKIAQHNIDCMFIIMSGHGSVLGMIKMLAYGVNLFKIGEEAIDAASHNGHLDAVNYLHNNGIKLPGLSGACYHGQLHIVKYLHQNGANLDHHALQNAAKQGHLEIVKYLIDNGVDVHTENDAALQNASLIGHLEMVKYLISKGANIETRNNISVCFAIQNKHTDVAKYLLDNGADSGQAIRWAAEFGNLEIVKHLVDKVDSVDKDIVYLNASRENHMEIANFIMKYRIENNEFLPHKSFCSVL